MTHSIRCPFIVYIDTAEQHPFDFKGLRADANQDKRFFVVETELRCLGRHPDSLGDYSFEGAIGRCHVERKSLEDFQSTLLGFEDGHRNRFEQELSNLSEIESPLVVVECTKEMFLLNAPEYGKKDAQTNAKILYRSALAMAQDYRVQIEWSGSRKMAMQDTFRWFYRFWDHNIRMRKKRSTIVPELPATNVTNSILEEV